MAPADKFVKSAYMVGAVALAVAGLYLAKGLLVPLTLAVLLSFLLSPVCNWLERCRLPRIPAVLLTATFGFALFGVVAWTAVEQMTSLAPKMPVYQSNLRGKLHSLNDYFIGAMAKWTSSAAKVGENLPHEEKAIPPEGTVERPFSVNVLSSPISPLQVLGQTFGTLVEVLGLASIVVVLVVFFLIRREDLRDRFIRLVGEGHTTMTTQMLEDAATRVSRYLLMLLIINSAFGIAIGIGLFAIGVPNAILWGILATTFRFVPYIGPWIAAAAPICLATVISTGWTPPIFTFGLFVILELFCGNVLEPWLYGKGTGVSAVAVLLSAVFWTWLWGIPGLLLATPLTVCLLVVGKHVPNLAFLDVLLGNQPVFEPKRRVYQRLLSGDQEGADELIESELKRKPLAEAYDSLLVPALALAETEWLSGALDDARHALILQSLKEIIRERTEDQDEERSKAGIKESASPGPYILCLPARDEADEIAGMMLTQILAMDGGIVQSVSFETSAADLLVLVVNRKPEVVCISATPPAAVMHARHLCRLVRSQLPKVPIVVGLWDAPGDLSKAIARIGGGEKTHIVATLTEAQAYCRSLHLPQLAGPEMQASNENAPCVIKESGS